MSTVGWKNGPPRRSPPASELAAPLERVGDVALDLLERRLRRSAGRPRRRRSKPSADLQLRRGVGEARRRTRRRSPSCTSIRLAEMHVWPELRNLQMSAPATALVEVGVVEDDERRVAAELERDLLHLVRALPIRSFPTSVEPVKPSLRTIGFDGHLAPDLRRVLRIAGDDREDARRHARLLGERGDRERGERCLLGRLQHHRAAGGERGRGLARRPSPRGSSRA